MTLWWHIRHYWWDITDNEFFWGIERRLYFLRRDYRRLRRGYESSCCPNYAWIERSRREFFCQGCGRYRHWDGPGRRPKRVA